MNEVTEFGKFLRKLRIENNEYIKDMAKKLKVSITYVSSVERGKRNIPGKWEQVLIDLYNLNNDEIGVMRKAISESTNKLKLDIENFNNDEKELIYLLVNNVDKLSEKDKCNIKNILEKYHL